MIRSRPCPIFRHWWQRRARGKSGAWAIVSTIRPGASDCRKRRGRCCSALTGMHRWVWITGNHNRDLIDRCGGEVVAEALVDGLVLRHEADPAEQRPELSGHFHPKLRLTVRGRRVARQLFRRDRAQADPARLRHADRRARRRSSRDHPRRRRRRAGDRRPRTIACCASRSPPDRDVYAASFGNADLKCRDLGLVEADDVRIAAGS